MKIAFVLSGAPHYFFFDRVVRLLYALGHEVRVVCRPGFKADGNKSGRALLQLLKDEPRARFDEGIFRAKGAGFAVTIRELANYANFLKPDHPMPPSQPWEYIYMRNRLHPKLYWAIKTRIGSMIFSTSFMRRLLRWIESCIEPDPKVLNWLAEFQPQVLFVSPYIMSADLEVEYVKAAQKLGIPTVASVLSWDNLVSKGTYLVRPDWLLVWNQNLMEEAIAIHEFAREKVFITGAPVYDPWFDLKPSPDREAFCAECGLNPNNPFVLFLGSSQTITSLDVEFIKALIAHFETMDAKNRPSILIRPHPYAPFDMTTYESDWVRVYPKQGGRPDMDETRQVYFNTLHYSAAVVGVNTTGFLDAAIVDRPCVTLMDDQMRAGQGAHFDYLIDADFIDVAKDRSEVFCAIDRIVAGTDSRKDERREFIRRFMRPQGIEIPASEVMAKAILAVGNGMKPGDWNGKKHE